MTFHPPNNRYIPTIIGEAFYKYASRYYCNFWLIWARKIIIVSAIVLLLSFMLWTVVLPQDLKIFFSSSEFQTQVGCCYRKLQNLLFSASCSSSYCLSQSKASFRHPLGILLGLLLGQILCLRLAKRGSQEEVEEEAEEEANIMWHLSANQPSQVEELSQTCISPRRVSIAASRYTLWFTSNIAKII